MACGFTVRATETSCSDRWWTRDCRFGWVTLEIERCGASTPRGFGRVFLFNFFTKWDRGRSLYPNLLLSIRSALAREQMTDFVIDVNCRNTRSTRGAQKAGFLLVAQIGYLTLFSRWIVCLKRCMLDTVSPSLFHYSLRSDRHDKHASGRADCHPRYQGRGRVGSSAE